MPRKLKDPSLQSREARGKLTQRDEPYWRVITEGLHIGYRKGSRSGVWRVRLLVGESYVKRSLGSTDDVLDADGIKILDWKHALEAAQQFEKDSKANGGKVRDPITVNKATERYLEWFKAHHKAAGYATAESYIRVHVLPTFGEREIDTITADEIGAWLNKLAITPGRLRSKKTSKKVTFRAKPTTDDEKRSRKATANRIYTTFKALLNKAFNENLVTSDDAWRRIKPFGNTDTGSIRHLKPDEATRLINACPTELRMLVRAALYTGARYGELARLTVADVNLHDCRIFLSAAAKSGKPRYVPLSPEGAKFFADLIAGRSGDSRALLKSDGTVWGHNHHTRAYKEANIAAKITPVANFHALRHSYATMFANIPGNTLDVLAEILGHADTRITRKHYAHMFDDTKKRAVANMPSLGYEMNDKVTAFTPKAA